MHNKTTKRLRWIALASRVVLCTLALFYGSSIYGCRGSGSDADVMHIVRSRSELLSVPPSARHVVIRISDLSDAELAGLPCRDSVEILDLLGCTGLTDDSVLTFEQCNRVRVLALDRRAHFSRAAVDEWAVRHRNDQPEFEAMWDTSGT